MIFEPRTGFGAEYLINGKSSLIEPFRSEGCTMKKFFIPVMLILFWVLPVQAADIQINAQFNAVTGDSDFDAFLRRINVVGGNSINVFVSDLSSGFQVPEKDIHFLIYEERVQPADALMILQLVRITGKPVRTVITKYRTHRKRGWGAIALAYGIKPGSREFHLLKANIPSVITRYVVVESKGSKGSKKGSKGKRGWKAKKGSKGSKGSKIKKGSKGKHKHKH